MNQNNRTYQSVLATVCCAAALHAWGGFTKTAYLDGNYDAKQPLQNGTVYVVTNNVEFIGSYDGKSGLAVAPGAEVVIYLQNDCWLDATGNNAETGGAGAGAGILCPPTSTLIVTGPGKLSARGGDAAGGESRGKATPGFIDDEDKTDTSRAGRGGKGGDGGGGAGAGIGGVGGTGGIGHEAHEEETVKTQTDGFDKSGWDGVAGGDGGNGGDAGLVWLLGTAQLYACAGGGGNGGQGLEYSTYLDYGANRQFGLRYYYIGGGGMGGGGAGGNAAPSGIGGGGAGGGAGGSGGNGARYYNTFDNPALMPCGGIGYGGKSADGERNGGDGWFSSTNPGHAVGDIYGGQRGAAGAAGTNGTGGRLNFFATASFNGTVTDDERYQSFSAPDSVKYVLTFESAGSATVYLGKPLSEISAPVPNRFGKTFDGWYPEENGGGERWFDGDGKADGWVEWYGTVGDVTLYPAWKDVANFNPADYRLDAKGIDVGAASVAIPVGIQKATNLDYALDFVKVLYSTTLPIPDDAPTASMSIETLENGQKVLVIPRDPNVGSMFYRIDVGE